MPFTFQINHDVQFNHNQRLLKKANDLTPKLKTTVVKPIALVRPIKDSSKLGHIGMKKVGQISDLLKNRFKRDDDIIIDFGKHNVGYFQMAIKSVGSHQDAPLALRLKFAEMPAEFAYRSDDYDGWLSKSWIQEEVIHIDQLPVELKLPRRYAFRYVEIKVIDTSPKWSVVFHDPQVDSVSSADDHNYSPVRLRDHQLQDIYDVSVKTLHDCMQDVFEDGPKRDRRLWLGDLRLQALSNYATFQNDDLVKRCLYLFGGMSAQDGRIPADVFTTGDLQPDDTFLLDYGLFFVSTLYDYEEEVSDPETLQDLYPVAKHQVDVTLKAVDAKGAYIPDDKYPVFVDWSNEFDKTTAGEAIIIYAFKQFIFLAKQLGKEKDADKVQQILEKMISYSQTILFNHEKGLFASGQKQEFNVASQVWMVLAEVVSKEQTQQIMETTKQQLFPIRGIATPYMYHHVAAAFFKAGLTDLGIQQLKDYWGKMIQLGADTYWEAFEPENPNYSPYGSPIVSSFCHAWGCTPAYLIKKYLVD